MENNFTEAARRVPISVKVKNETIHKYQKGAKMAYKKPKIVAKSAAKQSFAAGCPTNTKYMCCTSAGSGTGHECEIRRLK